MSVTSLTADRIPAGVYNVDPAHSSIGFAVKHMGIATVRGTFRGFEGTVEASVLQGFTFHSTGADAAADGEVRLSGQIGIKGVTRPIELTGAIAENGQDPWGNERIGLELEGSIDRREFDLKWNQTLPNGNLLVANEVKLLVSVSAVKSA